MVQKAPFRQRILGLILSHLEEEKKQRYEKMGDQMKLYGLHIPIDEL